jgi:hypothetical protein
MACRILLQDFQIADHCGKAGIKAAMRLERIDFWKLQMWNQLFDQRFAVGQWLYSPCQALRESTHDSAIGRSELRADYFL